MISPNTISGTKIICVDDIVNTCLVPGYNYNNGDLDGLKKDQIYTVVRIVPCIFTVSKFTVIVAEIDRVVYDTETEGGLGFDISRFRYLELPKCLTDILTSNKIPELI